MEYEKNYEIKYYEMNLNSGLKESSLLLFLQDIATQSAEFLGFGPSFVFSHNYAWFLLKYKIEFNSYPIGFDNLLIKTHPRGGSKLFAYRDFEIFNPENELIGRANSIWAVVDLGSKKMLPITKTIPNFPPYEKNETDLVFEKVPQMHSPTQKGEFDVCFDDIDINKHANNANYIKWALGPLSNDFRLKNTIKTIDMNFKKEIGFDGKVQSIVEFDPILNTTNHLLKNLATNDELCTIFIKWEDNTKLLKKAKRVN